MYAAWRYSVRGKHEMSPLSAFAITFGVHQSKKEAMLG
jgi:hypothetical protein